MKWIERLKAKFKKKTEEEFVEGEMWDFRQNFWGHALNFSETPNEDHSRDVTDTIRRGLKPTIPVL